MKIFVDENIPIISANALRSAGHDVLDIRGTQQEGMFDDDLWLAAQTEGRILVTTDRGFSEHRDERHHGIPIVRLRQPNELRIHARVMAAFEQCPEGDWPGLLLVMRDVVQSAYRSS